MGYRVFIATVLLAAIGGCNNADDTGTAGAYSGTISSYIAPQPPGAPSPIFGVVGKDGTGYFLAVPTAGSYLTTFQGLTSSGTLTSPEYDVPTEGLPVPRGAQNWQFTITATNASATTYELQGRFMGVDAGMNVDLKTLPITLQGTAPAQAGTYQGPDVNRLTNVVMTLDATGILSGSDGLGCQISGALTEEGNLNLYDVNLNITGSSSCHGALSGTGFFDTKDWTGQFSGATGIYLYLLGSNGDFSHGFAMALKLE